MMNGPDLTAQTEAVMVSMQGEVAMAQGAEGHPDIDPERRKRDRGEWTGHGHAVFRAAAGIRASDPRARIRLAVPRPTRAGARPAHTFGFGHPHWAIARTSRLGRPGLIG